MTNHSPPISLADLRAIPDIEDRIRATTAYIDQAEALASDARDLRATDVRALIAEHGPSEAARRSGLSLSTVKAYRGRP